MDTWPAPSRRDANDSPPTIGSATTRPPHQSYPSPACPMGYRPNRRESTMPNDTVAPSRQCHDKLGWLGAGTVVECLTLTGPNDDAMAGAAP